MDFYFRSALAPSSQRTYSSAQQSYSRFCTTFGLAPLPVSEHQLCQFCSHLAARNLTHSTIKGYLSAIRHLQIAAGLPDPVMSSMAKLNGVIKATRARGNPSSLPTILRQISAVWEAQGLSQDQVMLWAASTVCFLRARELRLTMPSTQPPVEDITVDDIANPSMLKLHLKASKTDPFRKGVDVVVGRTQDKLCPIAATLAYLALRGKGPGFLFQFRDGKPLTKTRFVDAIRSALATAGLNPKDYAGHSFRIGAATTAHSRGLNDSTIQTLRRWSSSAYLVYMKTPKDQLAVFSSILSA